MVKGWTSRRLGAVLLIGVFVVLAGCATRPPASDPEALAEYKQKNDPLEPLNRATLQFNEALDKVLFRPLTLTYRHVFPKFFRKMVENFMRNLRNPVYFANDLFQGDVRQAGVTLGRLVVNSTAGIGGLFDPATGLGLEHRDEDFGQTLGTWGAGEGFYLVLPVLGPSSVRDSFGLGIDFLMDPFTWVLLDGDQKYLRYVRRGIEGLDLYERNIDTLDDVRKSSLDYYSALRSYYRQLRADDIRNGAEVPATELEEFEEFDELYDDMEEDQPAEPSEPSKPQPKPDRAAAVAIPPLDLAPRQIP